MSKSKQDKAAEEKERELLILRDEVIKLKEEKRQTASELESALKVLGQIKQDLNTAVVGELKQDLTVLKNRNQQQHADIKLLEAKIEELSAAVAKLEANMDEAKAGELAAKKVELAATQEEKATRIAACNASKEAGNVVKALLSAAAEIQKVLVLASAPVVGTGEGSAADPAAEAGVEAGAEA